jgi:hypothetical protein
LIWLGIFPQAKLKKDRALVGFENDLRLASLARGPPEAGPEASLGAWQASGATKNEDGESHVTGSAKSMGGKVKEDFSRIARDAQAQILH